MRAGIVGYGNVGRALDGLIIDREDLELVGVFTRREPSAVKTLGADVYPLSFLLEKDFDIDVLFLGLGSSRDLPELAPSLAERFNTIDAYDNHARIAEYKSAMDAASRRGGKISLIAMGWDPGLLSLIRLFSSAFLPHASVNTFWGRGVSQGHSEALKRIAGVRRAIQYTVPREDALTLASLVSHPFTSTERHRRVCYIVAEAGREGEITEAIQNMDGYFLGYETEIHFISDEEFSRYHTALSHRGRVIALGSSGRYREVKHSLFFDLDIGSNPDLTASIMLASARALYKIKEDGGQGAYTPFDVPPSYFSPFNRENANNYL